MRVVQYNILSTDLATKFYYINTDTKYLQPEARWLLLKEKLLIEIENNSIFCLQEVSLLWLEKLLPFFQNFNYSCQYNNYDWKDTGFMGIMIAYPNQYKLEAVKIMNIGNQIETRIRRISEELILDDWVKAIRKRNMLLCLRLCDIKNDKSFCIGTYHMPPEYKNKDVATLHLVMCNQLMNKFAGNYKYILAGDFNFSPNSILYNLITKGGNGQVEKSLNYDTSSFSLKILPLTSVYGGAVSPSLTGDEPAFTNYVHLDKPFSGCLDYIFVSRGWKINNVKKLPINLPDIPYPNGDEPSDHLMIAAELELIK